MIPSLSTQTLPRADPRPAFAVLAAISFSHLLNDTIQSLLPAIYPFLKTAFALSFAQVGLMTLALMLTASLLQPVVGLYTDRRPMPYALVVGMGFSLVGLLLLAFAGSYPVLLAAAGLLGIGSSIFHPESSRVARMASGGQHGLAQSVFQVGGNAGTAVGPLLAAFIVLPRGQGSIAWFSFIALLGILVLMKVGAWYKAHQIKRAGRPRAEHQHPKLPRRKVVLSVLILVALIFSKYFYLASITSYYTFYLIAKFHLPIRDAQLYLFLFLGAVAAGT